MLEIGKQGENIIIPLPGRHLVFNLTGLLLESLQPNKWMVPSIAGENNFSMIELLSQKSKAVLS